MELDKIIGQSELVGYLKRLITHDLVGHAYALSGPEGIGKKTLARAFAKDLLCQNPNSYNCNCISCRTFNSGTNPDFFQVVSDKKSIGVDSIRELQDHAAHRPTYGNRKVYLIPDAELMTPQAQNCLLKTLEEPPKYVIIILLTTNFEALLPTIQSRTVNLRMTPYSDEEMRMIVGSRHNIPNDQWEFILRFSSGIPLNAIRMIEEGAITDLRAQVFQLFEKSDDLNYIENFRKTLLDNRENIPAVFDILLSVYRDCLVLKLGMEDRLINSDKKGIIKHIASSYQKHNLFEKIANLERMRRNFSYNINLQLGIDTLLLEIQEV
ncbi:DNA polymerase III subunit delta' [Thermoclostridium stercorarium subsp. stercorarium DSM 8532]|uniref:DNA polymerase III subunit delta' n=3 Tax=Thermoclostridium stercorarium TaxID=1510 RepID=L7VRP6_THES1|nr:DNA polymerase III subunit delta' C-terminal domain-containing protein [Thermoclostridium stercorarium]AGC68233.1 DNA polymerase III subunit delta' [Thermoclostridium stercorarium subsp. stercorarium DSM 8532]AGI39260.1 DNA polymerase-3 gamma-tau subunit [Thermoclostridium stercorarium subsp. stercorarium DSM 8532]ANW98595.1 DNA polymerase III subunit delta' [Thermoclostridium stercorarium subsp. thermolacticum DSM 2910]ANX01137.1 DNA polymerase III subunit delta' [Thermoclostridium stercora